MRPLKSDLGWYTVKRPCPFVFLRTAKLQLFSLPPNKLKKKIKKSPHEKRNQPHVGRHQGGVYGRVRLQLRHRELLWPGMAAPKKPHQRPIQACPIQSPTDCPVLFLTDCPIFFSQICTNRHGLQSNQTEGVTIHPLWLPPSAAGL